MRAHARAITISWREAQDEIKTRHLKEAEIEALQQQLNVRAAAHLLVNVAALEWLR